MIDYIKARLEMALLVLVIRANYWGGRLFKLIGLCWRCRHALNFTRSGRGICPECGGRY